VNWVSPWNANNWAVTWEHGFVLRGFTETVLMAVFAAISLKFILIISAVAVCLCFCVIDVDGGEIVREERRSGDALCNPVLPGSTERAGFRKTR